MPTFSDAPPTVPAPVIPQPETAVMPPVSTSGLATAVPPTVAPSIQRQPEMPPVAPGQFIAPASPATTGSVPSPAATPLPPAVAAPAPVIPAAPMGTVSATSIVPTAPAMPTAPAGLTAPAPLPAQPSAIQPPAAVQPFVTSPAPVQRQPEAAPSSSEEDRNWRRLETIMRRHKEQAAAQAAVEGGTAMPLPPTGSEPPLPSFARPKPAAKPAPGTVSRQPAAPPRETPMVAVARGRAPSSAPVISAPTTPPAKPVALPTETTMVSPAASLSAAPSVLRTETAADTLLAAPTETVPPGSGGAEPVAKEPLLADTPLQAVWPVQTVQRTEAPAVTPPPAPASPFPTPTEPPVRPPTPQDFWVEERLAAVPPGMPTDSSVPLLRPRRPRPSRLTVSGADTPALMAEMGATARPEPGQVAVSPTIQRQPESEVGLVPTEIGALPPDLWTLIGQQPPVAVATETQAPPGNQTVMAKRDVEGATATFTASAQTEAPIPDVVTVPALDFSDYIQLEEGGEASSPAAAPDGGGEETEEKKEDEEVDINELARQVYAHIRQQLTIDRERERGRLVHKW